MIDNVDTADVMTLLTLFESQIENKVSWFLYICSALFLDIFINLESTPISVVEVFVNQKNYILRFAKRKHKLGPF